MAVSLPGMWRCPLQLPSTTSVSSPSLALARAPAISLFPPRVCFLSLSLPSLFYDQHSLFPSLKGKGGSKSSGLGVSAKAQEVPGNSGSGRRVWRRRKLTKKDEKMQHRMERVPFLEEQVRKIRETGKILYMDIERLLLSEENKFDFVNEVAAEATAYVQNNPDEYGGKKAILHVLSNRINESGFYRPEAYMEDDPFKPGPNYLRDEL